MLNPGLHMLMLDCKKKYKMSTVNLGLKVFEKNRGGKSKAPYRLLQEGLELLLPHMDDSRQVEVKVDFFRQIVQE